MALLPAGRGAALARAARAAFAGQGWAEPQLFAVEPAAGAERLR